MLCILCSLPGRSVVWCVALRLRAGDVETVTGGRAGREPKLFALWFSADSQMQNLNS